MSLSTSRVAAVSDTINPTAENDIDPQCSRVGGERANTVIPHPRFDQPVARILGTVTMARQMQPLSVTIRADARERDGGFCLVHLEYGAPEIGLWFDPEDGRQELGIDLPTILKGRRVGASHPVCEYEPF